MFIGKPCLDVDNITSAKRGELLYVNCYIFSYPESNITWNFVPCNMPSFDNCLNNTKNNITTFSVR